MMYNMSFSFGLFGIYLFIQIRMNRKDAERDGWMENRQKMWSVSLLLK